MMVAQDALLKEYTKWLRCNWNRHAPWYKLSQLSRDFLDSKNFAFTSEDVMRLNRHVHSVTRYLHKTGQIVPYTRKTWRIP